MLGSATAGYLRNKLGVIWRLRSLWAKMSLLAVIFALVPLFLYAEFRKAYQDSQDLLLQSVRGQGRVISQSLLPLLGNADGDTLLGLSQQLERFAGQVTTIKLLLAPAGADGDGFYYIASWPAVVSSNLEAERQILARQGVLDRLAQSCRGEMPFSLIYDRPTGGAEIVTAVTPLLTAAGCWAVVASFSADAFPAAHLGQPYWATPTVQFAAAIYLVMVVITFSTLFGIGGGLRRFARQAREIREHRRRTGSFAARNEIPELADVAAEFDRMVDALNRSASAIRRAAEDNAHAFKTPIAVIRQSLEPLRRALPPENQRVRRAIDSIDRSIDRLDGLVASARRLDEATADLVTEPRRSIDLQRLLGKLMDDRAALLPGRDIRLRGELSPGIFVLGSEAMIETVLENLIDNAASYAPASSEVLVRLRQERDTAHIEVIDAGPGVAPVQLDQIFDRYFSARRNDKTDGAPGFGIGLSIARRNVEAMQGAIEAENRSPQGLVVHIRLPVAPRVRLYGRAVG
jgi:two-component system, OmpR family, sensor histidine kinase ChvG